MHGAAVHELSGHMAITYNYCRELVPSGDFGDQGMWRYRKLLPLGDRAVTFPFQVGGTPLRESPALRSALGAPNLLLKDETTGPSASNKDRATALVLEIGLQHGVSTITTASTGNAGVSTAIGADAAGVDAAIFVPADCSQDKVAAMRRAGAHVFRVRKGYRAAFDLSRSAAAEFGWLDRNTGVNPVTLEAKKTVAFEIWEQLGRRMPDVVVAPVGDGPTLVGLAKGFRELRACDVAPAIPRLIGVQATGCQPLVRSWRHLPPQEATHTIADGIRVSEPAIGDWAVREVSDSGGAFVAVSDAELRSAMSLLQREAGVASEPAGAAALAGLRVALRESRADAAETVVVLVTGAPRRLGRSARAPGSEVLVSEDLDEVADAWQEISPRPGRQ
jgi:threonine synthase